MNYELFPLLKTKNLPQLLVQEDVRAENQFREKREMMPTTLRQIYVQCLLVKKPYQIRAIKGSRVFKVELAIEKKMTAIDIQSF